MWNLEKCYWWTCLQDRRDADVENRFVDTMGKGEAGMNWESSTDIYTLISVHSVISDSLWLDALQLARLPGLSPTPRVYSNSCPWSQWCHPAVSSSVIPFSSCLQSFPASGSFRMSQFFTSGGQTIGASASASFIFQWIFRTGFL